MYKKQIRIIISKDKFIREKNLIYYWPEKSPALQNHFRNLNSSITKYIYV